MDRREFVQLGGGLAAGALTVEVPASEIAPQGGSAPGFIIDSHNHWEGGEAWIAEMVRVYRASNAMACTNSWVKDLEAIRRAADAYPDVFIPFGRVELDEATASRDIARFHENGFLGIKFHSPQKNWDDPAYFQVYRLCEHLGLHMFFHTGISYRQQIDEVPRYGGSARMRPMYLDTLCRQFPNATIQGAHLGNPWYEEAAEAARWNPNLYFDLTGSTLHKLIKLNQLERIGQALWWAEWGAGAENPHTLRGGPSAWEHIVFGVDEGPSGLAGNIERYQKMMDANRVPAGDRDKIWGLTMARILKIDPRTKRRAK